MSRFKCLCLPALLGAAGLVGCASGSRPAAYTATPEVDAGSRRPTPYPITQPADYAAAVRAGTRTLTGEPGPDYWQQWTDYRLTARILPERKRLHGSAEIIYHNRSPAALERLYLHLNQNLHAVGAPRKAPEEVTGGVELGTVSLDEVELEAGAKDGPHYEVDATRMTLVPSEPVASGDSAVISIEFQFTVPQAGANGRMGWDGENLFFIAYWFPKMAVYDDVVGWQNDRFLGGSEFYDGFGSYELTVEVPVGWVVVATGTLLNPEEVLAPRILERLDEAEGSDEVIHVITAEDFGEAATTAGNDGWLTWHFEADAVRDVAFSVTRESLWDAARTAVGDRDADGITDYARVDAIYRELAPRWTQVARYSQHAIDFLSRYTGLSYPWPHMSAVEGSNIIGGGMEFPMMTLIGDYNTRGDSALYYVTAHELAHMWVPMIVSNDERRFSWMDEGTTSFNENQARKEFFPGFNHDIPDQDVYIELAGGDGEGEMMRRSDFHYPGPAFGVASYQKPASVLVALRAILGEETFLRAYHTYLQRWAYKHPYPWDMFNSFSSVSGRNLDWFWRVWYYETWTLDQAIAGVTETANGTQIIVEDVGLAPMPVLLSITRRDGQVIRRDVPVDAWLAGATRLTVTVPAGPSVTRVEIDPERAFPDVNRDNNVWTR